MSNENMNVEIKILNSTLLKHKLKLNEITRWLRIMNRPNGWHYDMDQVWILNELENAGIMPGATILDAGAGQGIMQYLLAARGYKIISLDFSPRVPPKRSRGIFKIKGGGDAEINYHHPYMSFIDYDGLRVKVIQSVSMQKFFRKIFQIPKKYLRSITSFLFYIRELFFGRHNFYGDITFLRAPFHDIPLESGSVDAIVSISAIEHADISLFKDNIDGLMRLLKPGAPILLTTSATQDQENYYDEKVAGWCFSRTFLKNQFLGCAIQFDIVGSTKALLDSKELRDRLDPYYYLDDESIFFKKRYQTIPYLPVSIKIIK